MSKLWDITVGKLLEKMAEDYPKKEAVKYIDRDYRRTYWELNQECDEVAKGLLAMGIKKGDHVAVWATNRPEWLVALFATAKIGAVLVTVNTNYKIFELEYLLRQSDSKALILIDGFKDADYVGIVNELFPQLKNSKKGQLSDKKIPFLEKVIYVGENTPDGMFHFNELYELAKEVKEEDYRSLTDSLDPHEIINMQYTSGTTGFPKGVMLTHYNIVNNGLAIGDCMEFTSEDKLCIPVPFFHCFGLVLGIMASVTHGAGMVPLDYYQPQMVMRAIQEEECTAVHGVPTMFIAILEHPEFKNYKFPKLRTGIMAGSPCPVKVMQQVMEEMGAKEITITYGQTEASPACTMTTTHDSFENRVATVGKVMPHMEAKVVDPETGNEVPCGVPGEFCVKGYNLMLGYYKMEEATRAAIDASGWLHTGDLAVKNEDGYYKITGRIKDMIIRGGENIYPKEIEEFLYTHPKISDVQVVGVPSKVYGEEIMACIILKENETLTEEEVKDFVKGHMARHKTPKYVKFMQEFPMTASGKIQKYKLREAAIHEYRLNEDAAIETA